MTKESGRKRARARGRRSDGKHEGPTRRSGQAAVPPEVQVILDAWPGRDHAGPPAATSLEAEARIFQAVSSPVRLRILAALARSPLCPCLLQELEPMRDPVLSYHLRTLRRAGLATMSARSNYRIYQATELGKRLASFSSRLRQPTPTRRG